MWKSLWFDALGLNESMAPGSAHDKFVRAVPGLWGPQLSRESSVAAAHFLGSLIGRVSKSRRVPSPLSSFMPALASVWLHGPKQRLSRWPNCCKPLTRPYIMPRRLAVSGSLDRKFV